MRAANAFFGFGTALSPNIGLGSRQRGMTEPLQQRTDPLTTLPLIAPYSCHLL
jgi:hypothetical protein